MEKKNILFLFLIVIFGVLIRIWNMTPMNVGAIDFVMHKTTDFFEIAFQNVYAPLYPMVSKLFNLGFLSKVYPYLSIIFDIISIIVLYFAGCEFNDKKNEELTGVLSAGFGGISIFLIHLAQNNNMYSLVFLLSALVILYSIKVINTQNKKYLIHVFIFNLLLILTFNLGIFFAIFDFLSIMSFYAKKRKNFESYFVTFVGLLFLISPVIPFVLKTANVSQELAQYSLPFNYKHILVYLTNMFSPEISLVDSPNLNNIGFWIFVIFTSSIGLFLSVKGVLHKRNSCYFGIALFASTFLSMLIMCICAHETLLSEYLITVYPMLIIAMANGVPSLKSKTLKVVLPTIFATITIFYIIVSNIISTNLF